MSLRKRIKRYTRNARIAQWRFQARLQGKQVVHFLHIGKTGGTIIKSTLGIKDQKRDTPDYLIIGHRHPFNLSQVRTGESCFFVVRDPIQRFISGFYSRQRKGLPRALHEWTDAEKQAFKQFENPNHLAEALSDKNKITRQQAEQAMRSIDHVRTSYWDWMISSEVFDRKKHQILWIGRQEQLNDDFEVLKVKLNLPKDLKLSRDPVQAHKNPKGIDKSISKAAEQNLRNWYAADYKLINWLKENYWIEEFE